MDANVFNLIGKVCPFPVVEVIEAVEKMDPGQTVSFLIDDPLAIKSIPEELEEFGSITFTVEKKDSVWEVVITKKE